MFSTTVISVGASLLYFAATLAILSKLFHVVGPNKKLVLTAGVAAIALHLITIINALFIPELVDFSLPNVISLVALLISAGITLDAMRHKANLIQPVAYGFSALLLIVLAFMPQVNVLSIDAGQLVLVAHIVFALIAYCILVIATLYAFQVAFINYKLKQKNIAAVNHLPPLMQVERQLFAILTVGTCCLVLSQVVGLFFIDDFFSKSNIHKTFLSVVALIIYATILWGHFVKGWRGKLITTLTTISTLVLTLAYFGSRFVKEFLIG